MLVRKYLKQIISKPIKPIQTYCVTSLELIYEIVKRKMRQNIRNWKKNRLIYEHELHYYGNRMSCKVQQIVCRYQMQNSWLLSCCSSASGIFDRKVWEIAIKERRFYFRTIMEEKKREMENIKSANHFTIVPKNISTLDINLEQKPEIFIFLLLSIVN